ncbi:acyl-CoA carboxylase subunit epsilon [Streptomyces sp. NPDC058657]|uniref:acyl-CoA carboxylase subunit epsilon n=1 Tax=unclassified Streptomyces TaxID=2593676 RepID=UPI003655EADE
MLHTTGLKVPGTLFRVERGDPDAEELAVLTAVLLSRAAAAGAEPDGPSPRHRVTAGWRRPERTAAFGVPCGWRSAGR